MIRPTLLQSCLPQGMASLVLLSSASAVAAAHHPLLPNIATQEQGPEATRKPELEPPSLEAGAAAQHRSPAEPAQSDTSGEAPSDSATSANQNPSPGESAGSDEPAFRDATVSNKTEPQVAKLPPSDQNLQSDDAAKSDAAESDADEEPASEVKPPRRRYTTLLLAEGFGRYGGFLEGEDLGDPDLSSRSDRVGEVGGQLTLGLMPGGRYFTMAGRLRGGAYLGGPQAIGALSAAMLFGANFLRDNTGRNFSYALGGFGVEFMPALNEDMLTAHVTGGVIVNGLDFSAGIDVGGNDHVQTFMFGMQLGWGHLF